MAFCPRCVQPVSVDATTCEHCGYSIPPLVAPSTLRTPYTDPAPGPAAAPIEAVAAPAAESPVQQPAAESAVQQQPAEESVPDEPMVTQAAPWESTTVIASVTPSRAAARVESEPRSRTPWFLAAAAVFVIVGVVLFIALRPSHSSSDTAAKTNPTSATSTSATSPTSASSADGRQQASVIAGFVTRSTAARSGVSDAIGAIGRCSNIAASVATLQNAATVRSQLIGELSGAHVDAIDGGPAVVADLRAALQASADADRHYAAWGTSALAGCTGQAAHTADFTAAQQSDTSADAAKASFVQSWNAIASRYGLTPTAVTSI